MATARDTDDDVLVRVENVVKYFPVKAGGFLKHTVGQVHAVDDVSLVIERGARRSAWSARPAAASPRSPAAWPG